MACAYQHQIQILHGSARRALAQVIEYRHHHRLAFSLNGSAFDSRVATTPFADDRQTRARLQMPALDLAPYPNIRAYLQRIGARPAYQRAMAKGDPDLVPLLPDESIERSYWISTRRELHKSVRLRVLWDYVVELCAREQGLLLGETN